jgi:2-polyprenyl-3-methyl-5-hydroxy-6-metoxy-1,4-benzoquinol methylase
VSNIRAWLGPWRGEVPTQSGYLDSPREEVQVHVPPSARRVLDVGCWQGAFGAALKERRPGTVVWAIESDADAASVAASRLDRVIVGSFPSDAPKDERFDVVTFLDVLEHLVDPWEALRRARELLKPDGAVVAAIPNVRHFQVLLPLLVGGRWEYQESGLLDRTHLRFFTRLTMLDLFATSGYCVDEIDPANVASRSLLRSRETGRAIELRIAP